MNRRQLNKINLILGIAVLILIQINPLFTKEINESQTITYRITKSRIKAQIKEQIIKTNNYQFDYQSFSEGTKVVTDIDISDMGVSCKFTRREAERTIAYTFDMYKLSLPRLVERTYRMTYNLFLNSTSNSLDKGYDLEIYPYIDPSQTTWDFFENFGESTQNYFLYYQNQGYNVNFQYVSYTKEDNFYFECWSGGEINGEYGLGSTISYSTQCNIIYDNHYKIIINKVTGIVQGSGIKGRVKGSLLDKEINVEVDYQFKKTGFYLKSYLFGEKFTVEPYLIRKICICVLFGSLTITGLLLKTLIFFKKKGIRG